MLRITGVSKSQWGRALDAARAHIQGGNMFGLRVDAQTLYTTTQVDGLSVDAAKLSWGSRHACIHVVAVGTDYEDQLPALLERLGPTILREIKIANRRFEPKRGKTW